MGQPRPLFQLLSSFPNTVQKSLVASGIQTKIVRVDGKEADHNTTTTAHERT